MAGYTIRELRELVREGIDSGPSSRVSLTEIKTEARRRLDDAKESK